MSDKNLYYTYNINYLSLKIEKKTQIIQVSVSVLHKPPVDVDAFVNTVKYIYIYMEEEHVCKKNPTVLAQTTHV